MATEMSLDATWEVNEQQFTNVDETLFVEEVHMYPVLYNTASKLYKNGRTTKLNALRAVAQKFHGSPDMVAKRLATIRTRVGRFLKAYRPSGSGADDGVQIPAEFQHLKWLFPFIKTRSTASNLVVSPGPVSDNDQSTSAAVATPTANDSGRSTPSTTSAADIPAACAMPEITTPTEIGAVGKQA